MHQRTPKAKKPLTDRRSRTTIGGLLAPHLTAWGSATVIARKAGITLSYLSSISHDRVAHVSEPVKRTLAEALGIDVESVSAALLVTEKKLTAALLKHGEIK